MTSLRFRTRLFLILALFAFVPSLMLTVAWSGMSSRVLSRVSGSGTWEEVAARGQRAIDAARTAPEAPETLALLGDLEAQLGESRLQARRVAFLADRTGRLLLVSGLVLVVVLTFVASRVAGHLSRQLSRPVDELVGWADLVARGERLPLPTGADGKGAPEFGVLRDRMRTMAAELEEGRRSAIEAERLAAFRESARQVAHELKNPLTPIRFAIAALQRHVGPDQRDTMDVLETETRRLEEMAKSFAQFGRLPEGPTSDVDLADLVRETVRATLPASMTHEITVACTRAPVIQGQHDALLRALANVLLNAVDATAGRGRVRIRIEERNQELLLAVSDNGVGIAEEALGRIWEPYVTAKTGGTGLGLAIVKQTVISHGGRVDAVSTPAHGTEIQLYFPFDARTTATDTR